MRRPALAMAAMFGAMLFAGSASAGTVLYDNFDGENGGVGQLNYYNFANFTVSNAGSGGAADLIGNGFFDFYPGNGLYVDVCGSAQQCAVLTTKQSFGPGTYNVTLDLAGNARINISDGTTISFGSYSNTVMLSVNQLEDFHFTETLTSASQLSIGDLGIFGPDIGNILLSVEVDQVGVPEPGTLALFGMALLALGGLSLRKKST